ncbi:MULTISPECIES: N-acetyltransferase [unclassified Fusibacter]|uniref:GNAT family N-acetyltransferase n=1 Tax=unclassified Fusibacter TaxID=2624464 RepID=UPI001FA9F972|nr:MULTISPECIES: GNAT family N-acetyltransferase [unclassified Fusibacter]MCK8061156.1 GNAT family N-acetyltransferase [Fusibacter sp. A2]
MVKIERGSNNYIDECVEALVNSELGRIYFSQPGKAEKAINKGFQKEEVWVALNDKQECVGFLWCQMNGAFHSFPYLHIIAIRSQYRNNGLGKELMNYFEKVICEGYSKCFLVVADFNPKAKKLYEEIGYKEVGKIDGLYKSDVTEFLMMKNLASQN